MNHKSWLPYPLCWNLPGSEYTNCIYQDGANEQFVFLPTATLHTNQRVLGVRTHEALNGHYVYWEMVVNDKLMRDGCGYTQLGIATQEARLRGSRLRRRGLFGYDEDSYVMDLRGVTLHKGIAVLNGVEHEAGQATFRVGFLFDGVHGRLKIFQMDRPNQDWAYQQIDLTKDWYPVFATLQSYGGLGGIYRPSVEIITGLRAPECMLEVAVAPLLHTSQAVLKTMVDEKRLPRILYDYIMKWIETKYKACSTFTKAMRREPFERACYP